MILNFSKYQATGNDFILIDDRKDVFPKGRKNLITYLCDRRFGIGSDGLILIQNCISADFHVQYFNPDGSESLCGNGSRCAIAFAKTLNIFHADITCFTAYDGLHEGKISNSNIQFALADITNLEKTSHGFFINTGSPHLIVPVEDTEDLDVYTIGKKLRYHADFQPQGVNVNFVKFSDDSIIVRTYERGVEGETLSCGTGVTAAGIIAGAFYNYECPIKIFTKGGELKVYFNHTSENHFTHIILEGPAQKVFDGSIQFNENIFQ